MVVVPLRLHAYTDVICCCHVQLDCSQPATDVTSPGQPTLFPCSWWVPEVSLSPGRQAIVWTFIRRTVPCGGTLIANMAGNAFDHLDCVTVLSQTVSIACSHNAADGVAFVILPTSLLVSRHTGH